QVADVAVFGIPDEDWGESVAAVVQPEDGVPPGPELAASILASLEGRLARMKWPKQIDFTGELPRDPSGKLLKRRLRDRCWQGRGPAIWRVRLAPRTGPRGRGGCSRVAAAGGAAAASARVSSRRSTAGGPGGSP